MRIISAKDYGFRKVIRVCLNPDEPESVHLDGKPHAGEPPPGTDPNLKCWEWCHGCRYNWQVREFTWTGDEMGIGLNRHGNPVRAGQSILAIRSKTWDELYVEITRSLGVPVEMLDTSSMPAEPAPAIKKEPAWQLIATGKPFMKGDLGAQQYEVWHLEVLVDKVSVTGDSPSSFATNKAAALETFLQRDEQQQAESSAAKALIG